MIDCDLLGSICSRKMCKVLDDERLTALKRRNACRQFVKPLFHALKRRLKALEMLKHKAFNVTGHALTLRGRPDFRDYFLSRIAEVVRCHDW